MTELTKEEMRRIWNEVKENSKKWRYCPKHFFPKGSWSMDLVGTINTKVKCENCGATGDVTNAADYARGYVAAGGKIQDVFPDME